ncbi:nitrite/sulfite reductase [Qipengyuania citrea]|uniref:nitrite/sulfite reductase n=1 Tax=Qipengyuania citrea TaxID=225971 RepID=UPI0032664BB7
MYKYDQYDQAMVDARVEEFRDQARRRLEGKLTEDQFKPLRLMNGLYLQLHAYMLRVAIPYGTLNSQQMHALADIADKYDRGYGHFTTRQNIQYNWIKLEDAGDILADLAKVEMHAIQTSGNCIRNISSDHFAGATADEVVDPRPYAELLRQWSSFHPEFSYLPRKFKIAVIASDTDRAAMRLHDIGIQIVENDAGELGAAFYVGGGMGRTPMIAPCINPFVPLDRLVTYAEACLRVYNRYGRRDNKYKARIKILVHETGLEDLKADIEAEFEKIRFGVLRLPDQEVRRIEAYFAPPPLEVGSAVSQALDARKDTDAAFAQFVAHNLNPHRVPGYTSVTLSMKPVGGIPGDASDAQMDAIADLAERFGHDELRISHEQNVILPHVKLDDLPELFDQLVAADIAEGNAGLITDIIACPGMDFCALATARSIPVAQRISERFGTAERQAEIGELKIKISGCINACGHHHVGHIGILGLEKKGEEFYQVTLGGSANENASIGEIVGRGFSSEEVIDAIEKLVDTYLGLRSGKQETFLEAYRRVGEDPFKEALYGAA